jgi:DNA polymerase II small subunit/DNA polymerase delta subunit B
MNHSHVKNLVNLGYLVDQEIVDLIENLNENDFYKLVEDLKKENLFLINKDLINKVVVSDVKIIKNFIPVKKFTVQDFVRNLNERYIALQSILLKRVEFSDLVSINKISNGNASIIGLIKEKTEKDENLLVTLEDSTGDIQAIVPKNLGEKLVLDDVVAVSGRINNKIFVDKLIYPDVPIRPVNYSFNSIKIAFLENKESDADYLIYREKIIDKIKNKIYTITNPCLVEIGGVVILVLLGFNPLDVLRKRYINIENTDFLVEPVPDIIFTDKDVNANYKGITIVSLNKTIDLKTREIQSG